MAWGVSNTLVAGLFVQAVARAIAEHGVPEIFNTDEGSQFISAAFTLSLLARGVLISVDGRDRGRALDNVVVERLWRTVKYEGVCLKSYRSQIKAYTSLEAYFRFCNDHRPHSTLGDEHPRTLLEVYREPLRLAINHWRPLPSVDPTAEFSDTFFGSLPRSRPRHLKRLSPAT